jgi:hypothetical protein
VAFDVTNLGIAEPDGNLSSANDGFWGLNGRKGVLKAGRDWFIFINKAK